jgi:hypothetical protein
MRNLRQTVMDGASRLVVVPVAAAAAQYGAPQTKLGAPHDPSGDFESALIVRAGELRQRYCVMAPEIRDTSKAGSAR